MSFKDEVNFCIDFLRIQEDCSEESCIYSPVSMLNALAMIYAGADGNTAEQIAAVIGKEMNKEAIINYYFEFIQRHKVLKEEKESGVTGSSPTLEADDGITYKIVGANKLFVDQKIKILDSFNAIITEKFDGQLQQVNFKNEKDYAVKVINEFINDRTNGLIKEICSIEDINDKTEIIFINALYFIGRWATIFGKRKPGMFYSKIPREIDLLNKSIWCNYAESEEWKCVGIPYKEQKVWMFIVLPNKKDGLQKLINKMDYSIFMECTKKNFVIVDVTIPVFEVSAEFDLVENLSKLGITDLFDYYTCNLPKMFENYYDRRHCIDKAIHKAVIKVDEYGTEATSLSRMDLCYDCRPRIFKADYPFLYFIVSADRPPERDTSYRKEQDPTEILFAGTFC